MAANESKFAVRIETSADRTGAQQVEGDLDRIKEKAADAGSGNGATGAPEPAAKAQILATEKAITAEQKAQGAAAAASAEAVALQGVNLERAQEAAGRFTRNLALGRDTTASLGSLLAELAPVLGPAAVAAFAVYEGLKAANAVSQTLGQFFGGFSFEELASGFDPKALIEEVNAAERLLRLLRDIDKETLSEQEASVERIGDKIGDLTQKYRLEAVAVEGLLEPITSANANLLAISRAQITNLQAELSLRQLHLSNSRLAVAIEEGKSEEIRKQTELLKEQIETQRAGAQLNKEFLAARDATLPAADKLQDFQTRIDTIKQHLRDMGIAAASPNEAFQKSIGLADQERNAIVRLATEWLNLGGNVKKAQGEIDNFEKQRGAGRSAVLGALDSKEIVDAANALQALNKQASEVLGLKASGPNAGLEKLLLDTITNGRSSTAEVTRFQEALRQLYAQEAAAPKQTLATQPSLALPPLVDIKPVASPAGALARGAAEGGDTAQKALQLQQETAQQAQQVSAALQSAIESIPISFQPIAAAIPGLPAAVESGNQAIAAAVDQGAQRIESATVRAVAELAATFARRADSLQKQINTLARANPSGAQ